MRIMMLLAFCFFTTTGCVSYYVDKAKATCEDLYPDDNLESARCTEELLQALAGGAKSGGSSYSQGGSNSQGEKNNALIMRCGSLGKSPDFVTGACR